MCFKAYFSMLRRILLHTTPYYILYKGEKLIYTEKFLLKLFFYTDKNITQANKSYTAERSQTKSNTLH